MTPAVLKRISVANEKRTGLRAIAVPLITMFYISPVQRIIITCEGQ
jgi:hypothetical protein